MGTVAWAQAPAKSGSGPTYHERENTMARMVKLTVTYDMDDMEKPLADELKAWKWGRIAVIDVLDSDDGTVTLVELED